MTADILAEIERDLIRFADDLEDQESIDGYGVSVRLREQARKVAVEFERVKLAKAS